MKKMKFLTAGLIAAMMVPAAAQAQNRDIREDRRDWRQDRRYRDYRAPFRYQQFRVGSTLRSNYYSPSYRPAWDRRWGVPRAGRNLTYVRHYNDLLLVNARNGKVVRVYRNHFRWR